MPLFYGTVNQLLINLVPFIVMIFLQKRHNYVTAQRIFNDCVKIKFLSVDIFLHIFLYIHVFADCFIKFVQKL